VVKVELDVDEFEHQPIPARNIARLYETVAEKGQWYPDFEYALKKDELIQGTTSLELEKKVRKWVRNFNMVFDQIWHTSIGPSAFGLVCKECDIIIHEIHSIVDITGAGGAIAVPDHFTFPAHKYKKILDKRVNSQRVRLLPI
jgi:hypothetical protein